MPERKITPVKLKHQDFTNALLAAAEMMDGYNSVSLHPHSLGDCLLAKYSVITKEDIRPNPFHAARESHVLRVKEKVWGPDDKYCTVDTQVFSMKPDQMVKVTVEPIPFDETKSPKPRSSKAVARPAPKSRRVSSRH